jgi:predicted GH43/DUF377 family glycosyl hydrolase
MIQSCELNTAVEIPIEEPISWLQQTQWKAGYFEFPYEREVRFFNPSIAEYQGNTWLATRRAFNNPAPFGINSIVLWRMDGTNPVQRHPVNIWFTMEQEQVEDPRLSVLGGHLFCSCCNFKVQGYQAHQVLIHLSGQDPYHAEVCHPLYGFNGDSMKNNTGNEKNWVWFDHSKDGWHFVYMPWPHHVVRTNQAEPCASYVHKDEPCPWQFGQMRGGTPPVLHDGQYWSFFHSSTPWQGKRRRYHMGCYTFEPNPPFRITSMTIDPLLTGSFTDGGTLPCIFPGGAILKQDKWLVVMGINDYRSAWIEIPHQELTERMLEL